MRGNEYSDPVLNCTEVISLYRQLGCGICLFAAQFTMSQEKKVLQTHEIAERDGRQRASDGADSLSTLELAHEAVRAGISQNVLDVLTSPHPQVSRHEYLLSQLYNTVVNDEELFMKMVIVFTKFGLHQALPTYSAISCDSATPDDYPLDAEHIPYLAEFLAPYASHWRDLGTALKFHAEDLENILACLHLLPNSPKGYLMKLLEDWIRRAHKHALPPSAYVLERALDSNLVGLGSLASKVRTHIPQRKDSVQEQTLPIANDGTQVPPRKDSLEQEALPIANDLEAARTDQQIISIECCGENAAEIIETNEDASVRLKVQVNSSALKFQWLANGKPLAENEPHEPLYSGTNTPTLTIIIADVCMDGIKYSCKITGGSNTFFSRDFILKVKCSLDRYTASLASMYAAKAEVPEDTWPPVGSKKHISLALIKQQQIDYSSKYAHMTIRGDMDDVLQQKNIIEYDEVLNSLQSRCLLFIEGRPGCGKTTFVHKITRDWATATSHGAIRLILLVSLRVLNTLNKPSLDLENILNLFEDLKVTKHLLEERDGKGVCFIFDGLDEFSPPDGSDSIVYKIITKNYLAQSTVIVASRPAAVAGLRRKANKDIEILGFRNEQILEYFDHYPFVKSKPADLKDYLRSHPNILHMCYLPIHAVMVAFLFEVMGKVPQTETEIYTNFTNFAIIRSL